jgi:ribosomal protein S18 acetylase RimI-like enzyme
VARSSIEISRGGPENIGSLRELWLERAARRLPARAGVGERLLDEADAELERQGITEAMIGVIPGNDRAQALYERRGFQPRWLILARSSPTSGAGDS